MFAKLSEKHVDALREIVGPGRVLLPHQETDFEPYTHDETEDLRFPPEVVVKPASTDEIARVMRLAYAENLPVTPRGAGTGLSGGALTVHGGICLGVERMNRILEIDEANLVCVAQPGVVVETLQTEIEKVGLFYPPDPASRGSCMIGGNIAENAGGPRAVKYGVTKDYVMGVEAVLPNGDVIRAGGKRYKDVTGYNLTQLFVGSEGTLGIVTEATLRLLPKPTETATVLAAYDSMDDAARTVPEIFKRGIFPTAAEFMERDAIAASAAHLGISFPHQDAEAHLLLMVDGADRERVVAEATRIGEACLEMGARDAILADNPARERGLWALRRAVGEAVKKLSIYKEEDTVAPRAALPALIRGVKEIARRHGVRAICYGHAGDGNIHCNIVKGDLSDRDWNERLPTAIEEIFRHTVSLGGTISGEHGIGWSQKRYLHLAMSPAELALLARVKAAFDPKGILNPGKVIPEGIGEG